MKDRKGPFILVLYDLDNYPHDPDDKGAIVEDERTRVRRNKQRSRALISIAASLHQHWQVKICLCKMEKCSAPPEIDEAQAVYYLSYQRAKMTPGRECSPNGVGSVTIFAPKRNRVGEEEYYDNREDGIRFLISETDGSSKWFYLEGDTLISEIRKPNLSKIEPIYTS